VHGVAVGAFHDPLEDALPGFVDPKPVQRVPEPDMAQLKPGARTDALLLQARPLRLVRGRVARRVYDREAIAALVSGLDRLPQRILVLEVDEEPEMAVRRKGVTGLDVGQLGERKRCEVGERSAIPGRGPLVI
jgi:hypothetical protein